MPPHRRRGPITIATEALIADLEGFETAGQDVYAAMAVQLARTLDAGAGLAVAAVNRELRETIKAMTGEGLTKGDDGDGDPRTRALLAVLSAPVGNPAN